MRILCETSLAAMVMAEGSTTSSGFPIVPGIRTVRCCMAATSRLSRVWSALASAAAKAAPESVKPEILLRCRATASASVELIVPVRFSDKVGPGRLLPLLGMASLIIFSPLTTHAAPC